MSTPDESAPSRETDIELARLELARLTKDPDRPSLRETLRDVCRIAANALSVERVGIWMFAADRKSIRCTCLYERSRKVYSEGVTLNVADFPDLFESFDERFANRSGGTIQNPCTMGMKTAYHDPLGIASMLDAPILVDGTQRGCACFEHVGSKRTWSPEECEFAERIAAVIASKLKGLPIPEAWRQLCAEGSSPAEERIREVTAQLSAGVAHDFRNLLQIVIGNAQLIANDPDSTPKMVERTNQILQAADRGALLATELTAIGKNQAGQPRIISATDAVSNFLPLLRTSVSPTHTIEFRKGKCEAKVFIDPMKLERIVLNLVLNAREASPRGGPIGIDVECQSREHPESVLLSVMDRGTGIEPDHLQRIFDPFFTTKPKGKGNGFGLSIVKRIVELAGGSIQVHSTVGSGTTVCCALPRASFVG